MIKYVQGYSDTDGINYCPYCGKEIYQHRADGTGACMECGEIFAVIEVERVEVRG